MSATTMSIGAERAETDAEVIARPTEQLHDGPEFSAFALDATIEHVPVERAAEGSSGLTFQSIEVTDLVEPAATLGDLVVSANAAIEDVETAGEEYGKACREVMDLEDQRTAVKEAAILALMAEKKIGASAAEKLVELNLPYMRHRVLQYAAVIKQARARGQSFAANHRARLSIALVEARIAQRTPGGST